MSEWKTIKLNTITEFLNRGISPKYSDSGNLIVNQKCIRENRLSYKEARYSDIDKRIADDRKLKIGDILVNSTGTGTLGRTAQVKEIHCVTSVDTHVTIVRINSNFDSRFIAYQLAMKEPEIVALGKGATNQQELGREELGNLEINLPPLPTQRRIASILSAYDDLIENNLKRIKLLEELAQRTYEEWFVKYRFNGEQLPIDEKTGLPEGWERIQIGEIVKFFKGKKAIEIIETKAEGYEKLILLDGIETGNFKYTKSESQVIAKRGDLLMLMDGARSSKVFFSENGVVGSTFSKLVINSSFVDSYYLKLFFEANYETMQANNTGAAIPHANKSFINSMSIVIAEKIFMENWRINSNGILNQIQNLKDQIRHLKQSRDILLPRLMSGKINVE